MFLDSLDLTTFFSKAQVSHLTLRITKVRRAWYKALIIPQSQISVVLHLFGRRRVTSNLFEFFSLYIHPNKAYH